MKTVSDADMAVIIRALRLVTRRPWPSDLREVNTVRRASQTLKKIIKRQEQ